MVQMDPKNLEWRYCLYSIYRYQRRSVGHLSAPSNNEIRMITDAYNLPNAESDDDICVGYVFGLAEIVRSQPCTPVQYGAETYYSIEEIEKFIRMKVE